MEKLEAYKQNTSMKVKKKLKPKSKSTLILD